MTLGERIVWHRQLLGIGQNELADKAGISRVSLWKYENDMCDPKLLNATCIADALGISLDYLARGGKNE
jgi:transcriptional regulator with XRE-family HTH domain